MTAGWSWCGSRATSLGVLGRVLGLGLGLGRFLLALCSGHPRLSLGGSSRVLNMNVDHHVLIRFRARGALVATVRRVRRHSL